MKNNISRTMLRKLSTRSIVTGSALLALGLHPALAQTPPNYQYTGGGIGTATAPVTGNMNPATSWVGGVKPPSAATTNLLFGGSGSTAYTATQNAYNPFMVNTLVLSSTASVAETIGNAGNVINFAGAAGTTGIVQNGSGAFVFSGSGTNNFTGTNGLTVSGTGTGTITFSKGSTYTGDTTVNFAGTLQAGVGTTAFGGSANSLIINAGTVDLNGFGEQFNSLQGAAGAILTNSSAAASNLNLFGATNGTFAGNITGNVIVNKNSTATETFTGTNTYSGGTVITSGTLSAGEPAAGGSVTSLGTGLITINSGGQLRLNGPGGAPTTENLANSLALNGGTLTGVDGVQRLATGAGSTVAVTGTGSALTTQFPSKDIYVDGQMTGIGTLSVNNFIAATFDGQGIVHFTNAANTYSGTITSAANIGTTVNGYSGGRISVDSGTALQSANVVNNSGGTTTFTGNGTANSQTFQNLVGIQFGPAVTSATFGSLAGTGNFALTNTAASPGAVALTEGNGTATVYAGAISGSGSLTQVGTGSALTLSNTNTYAGGTTVSGGTLTAAHDGALGSGTVSVGSNGVLTLTGGTLNDYIGDTASLLLTASNNASPFINLSFTGTDIIGSLSFDGGTTFAQAGTYGAVGSGALFTNSDFAGNGTLTVGTIAAAPEPSQWLALGMGALSIGILGLRARRRRSMGAV